MLNGLAARPIRRPDAHPNALTLSSLLIDGSLTLFSYVKYGWFAARLSDHN